MEGQDMAIPRTLATAGAAVVLLGLLAPSAALATKPALLCPAGTSGYYLVDKDEWWANTVAGFEAEGIQVYQSDGTTFTKVFDDFSAAAGFGSAQGLYDFIWYEQWDGMDKNANGYVCMKNRPHTPGNPAFFFNGVDDQSSSKHGDAA